MSRPLWNVSIDDAIATARARIAAGAPVRTALDAVVKEHFLGASTRSASSRLARWLGLRLGRAGPHPHCSHRRRLSARDRLCFTCPLPECWQYSQACIWRLAAKHRASSSGRSSTRA